MLGSETLKYNFADKKFLVFDYETSCLNLSLPYNRVWQAAWLVCDGYKIVETHNHYVKWDNFYICDDARIATHYNAKTHDELGEDPKKILDLFNNYLYNEKYIIVGQNILNFDIYLHNLWQNSLGYKTNYSYVNRIIDIRALANAYQNNLKFKLDENFLAQQYRMLNFYYKGMPKATLTHLCQNLGISVDPSQMHDAAVDIAKSFEVFKELVKKVEI